jgi:hypothetical protein
MANGAPGPQQQQQPLPGWLGPIVTVTTQFGVPTVFAAVLLYFVLTNVVGSLAQMQKNDEDRMRMLAAMQDTLIGALTKQTDTFERATNTQTEKFVAAINANIATNQSISQQLRQDRAAELQFERERRERERGK